MDFTQGVITDFHEMRLVFQAKVSVSAAYEKSTNYTLLNIPGSCSSVYVAFWVKFCVQAFYLRTIHLIRSIWLVLGVRQRCFNYLGTRLDFKWRTVIFSVVRAVMSSANKFTAIIIF
jgi:hypothetical protein